ncbi:MAG: glycosyltransferase family 4 protein [Candidatus Sericytochromatia bacterium]|nr:glycosyltransferase family 4 protein [Candidatus Sericytochromatia bacterium]
MRIAVLGKKYPFCGIVTYCRELIGALRQAGHQVMFCHVHDAADGEECLPALLRTPLFVVPRPAALRQLADKLQLFSPDLVHASFALGPLDWCLPRLCQQLGIPLVATFHVALDHRPSFPGQVSALVYQLYGPTLRACQRVIVFSEGQARRVAELGVPGNRLRVLPHGVDLRRYSPGESHFRRAHPAHLLFTYMGRLDPEKNVHQLLSAWAGLRRSPDTKLALVGDGVLAARLRARWGHLSGVHWLGWIQDEAARIDILRGSDVFLLPSSIEGLSLALLEAMACGAVPAATDVGADGEVISGVGWTLDPSRLSEGLPQVMQQAIASPDEIRRRRPLVRQRIEQRYGLSDNMLRLQRIYHEALSVNKPLAP